MDINNSFLNGELQEEVYIWQPKGFESSKLPHHLCRLHKAIYGLKQAPRAWFKWLKNTLLNWGFYNTKGDNSLSIHKTTANILIILIHIDDILVTGSSIELRKFAAKLNQMFSLKELGDIHYFLGLEIKIDE